MSENYEIEVIIGEIVLDYTPIYNGEGKVCWRWRGNEQKAKEIGIKTTKELIKFYKEKLNIK